MTGTRSLPRRVFTSDSPLAHSLVGTHSNRTAVAVAYLLVFAVLFSVSHLSTRITVDGVPLDAHTTAFDGLSAAVIFAAQVTILVAPFVYAVVNGGPALSFTIAIFPVALGEVAAGRYVLGVDGTIALTVGAAAAALAIYASDVRRTETVFPWRKSLPASTDLLTTTILIASSFIASVRFAVVAPQHVVEVYAPFAFLWLLPLTLVLCYGLGNLRQ